MLKKIEKYKTVEKMWLDVTNFFNIEEGKEIKNFEEIILSYGTDNFLKQIKNKLPWGIYTKDGKYYIAEGWGGDMPYEGLKGFEDIKITDSSISATVVTKKNTYNGSEWVEAKDGKSEFKIVKKEGKWFIDYFDFSVVFEDLDSKNVEKIKDSVTYIENNELIGSWKPEFAEKNGKEISLMEIYGSAGATGEMNFDSNGKYTAFIGTYSSEIEDDLKGDYINERSSVTLIANSGKKDILTIKRINGRKYLEKSIKNITVYFSKSVSSNENKEEF